MRLEVYALVPVVLDAADWIVVPLKTWAVLAAAAYLGPGSLQKGLSLIKVDISKVFD